MTPHFKAVIWFSLGQRASKLQAIKVGGLKKKSANRPRPYSNHSAQIQLFLGSNHSQTLTASNFEALLTTNPILTALKDLNLLKKHIKNQEANKNYKLGFALSKRPQVNSVYLVRVPFLTSIAVCGIITN